MRSPAITPVLTIASVTLGGLAWLGHLRLGRDVLPGEVWNGTRDAAPTALSSAYRYQAVDAEQAGAVVAKLRANRAGLYPCAGLVELALIRPGVAAAEERPGEQFRIVVAAADRWAIEHARDEKSFVGSDRQRLVLRMGWDPVGIDLPWWSENDGGPLSLPSWMLQPDYVVALDPEEGMVQLQSTAQAGALLQATFHVELERSLVREVHLVLAPPEGRGQPIQLQQKLLEYEHLDQQPPPLAALAEREADDFELVHPEEPVVFAPPVEPRW